MSNYELLKNPAAWNYYINVKLMTSEWHLFVESQEIPNRVPEFSGQLENNFACRTV